MAESLFEILTGDYTKDEVLAQLPRNLQNLAYNQLKTGEDVSNKFIVGAVEQCFPLAVTQKRNAMKISLKETRDINQRLDVHFFNDYTDCSKLLNIGDLVVISNPIIERNPKNRASPDPLLSHPCQLVLDKERQKSYVWVKKSTVTDGSSHKQTSGQPTSSDLVPSVTSDAKQPCTSAVIATNQVRVRDAPTTVQSGVSKTNKKDQPRSYTYVTLDKIKLGAIVHVWGVVKYFQSPTMTRGSDYKMMVSIVDPTCPDDHSKLKCCLFFRQLAQVPQIKAIGDIVRLHRLRIVEYNGAFQGNSSPGFSCVVFDGQVGAPFDPRTSAKSFSVTEEDKAMVRSLRDWKGNHDNEVHVTNPLVTFDECIINLYFDNVCQVIGTAVVEPGVCVVLRVWDGTKVHLDLRMCDVEQFNYSADDFLVNKAQGLAVDVWLYDDHFLSASAIKPGEFIKITNLHSPQFKESTQKFMAEFIVHRGYSYNRGIKRLDESCMEVENLKQKLSRFDDGIISQNSAMNIPDQDLRLIAETMSQNKSQNNRADGERRLADVGEACADNINDIKMDNFELNLFTKDKSRFWKHNKNVTKYVADENHSEIESNFVQIFERNKRFQTQLESRLSKMAAMSRKTAVDVGGDEKQPRCLQQSASVITDHHHIDFTNLQDVITGAVPGKFRVRARLTSFYPHTDDPKAFLMLSCGSCNQLVQWNQRAVFEPSVDPMDYLCYSCISKTPAKKKVIKRLMEPLFFMTLTLQDHTGEMEAILSHKDAETFLGMTAKAFMSHADSESLMVTLNERLEMLVFDGKTNDSDWLECCVLSCNRDSVRYNIFDTQLLDAFGSV